MGQWLQRFIASSSGEVSNAAIQGYLRAAIQIEDVWQQIDDQVDLLIGQGMAPWDAYATKGYALAFVRACRSDIVFVQELLKAYADANPKDPNYLPRMSYDQALALCQHIEPFLEEAIKASASSHYAPNFPFPLPFGPHISNENQPFPLPHLQGIIGAAQQMRDWAAGLLAKYELAIEAAKTPVPQAVTAHLERMKEELRLGDFHLRTGIDMVGQISQGQVPKELNEKAEGFLWESMESFFKLSQLIANPAAAARPAYRASAPVSGQQPYIGRQVLTQRPNPNPNPPITRRVVAPAAQTPFVPQVPPAPPEPDINSLLNQVIAEPERDQPVPAQPSPDVAAMLNQVITGPEQADQAQSRPAQSATDYADLLSQVTAEPETAQAQPFNKQPLSKDRQQLPSNTASEDNLLDMLSNICGEQKESK
jgi:hypothetical protein